MDKRVVLKQLRDKPLRKKHPWIFSGAIEYMSSYEDGDLMPVFSHDKEMLGWGYFNKKCSLIGRIVSFGLEDPYKAIEKSFLRAVGLREKIFSSDTNSYRVVNAEGDNLPGLVLDRYDNVLVMQIATMGMEKLKPFIIELIRKYCLFCECLYEKSDMACRKIEGLLDKEETLFGQMPALVKIKENNLSFFVDVIRGQKSGFFLDQREMRKLVGELSYRRNVLNCFSYSGGFSVYAKAARANILDSVDSSKEAIELAKRNFILNDMDVEKSNFYCEDVFSFLSLCDDGKYDFIILDPPAFAKKEKDVKAALRGYRDINKMAMKKIAKGGFLLTCSCSYHVDKEMFKRLVFESALEVGREVSILSYHRLAMDHCINIFHPESDYLKSLLLYIA
jgi:23S rRNA (cytosine1962-C5)-methyltransferase